MCGFAGVVAWDEKYRVTRAMLEKMSRAIAHRGPDGEGYHLTRENEPITPETPQVAFAFRRLAILDPEPRSNQPFHIGSLSMVYNGEIYNFRDLKSEISNLRTGYHWRTTGDTEVLLMTYEIWREKCVEKLNGMFAIAIWDEQKKELFLARDRMGQKPLYWARAGGSDAVAFASEIAALRQLPWIPATISAYDRDCYLELGYMTGWRLLNEGIGRFRNSARLTMSRTSIQRPTPVPHDDLVYFDANRPTQGAAKGSHSASMTRQLVRKAVERQLVSDVPLGIFLSGGVDSSVITCCAREFGPVQTFSIGFDDPRYDETGYAAAVAKHLGTQHHRFIVKPSVIEDLPRLAAVFGEPFADSSAIPTHYLARETRKHVKVALSGDGGDELFGGYDRYRAMRLERVLRRMPRSFRGLLAGPVTGRLPASHPKLARSKMKRFLQTADQPPARRYLSYVAIFDHELLAELLGRPAQPSPLEEQFKKLLRGRDVVEAALALDRVTYLPDDLLAKVDRCSMLHGLEVRSPFMDHELVEFAAGLRTDQLLRGGAKRMLREAFAQDLPGFVFKRKKMGFAVPIGEWFRGELRGMLRDNLFATHSFARQHFNIKVVQRLVDEHETERVDHSQRLYALLMLELWWQQQRSPI